MVKKISEGSQTACIWLPFGIFLAIVLSILHDVWLPFAIFLAIVLSILHGVWLPFGIFLTIVLRQYNGQEDIRG
jgi:membrane protein implicated in regulation of membrane protease activity